MGYNKTQLDRYVRGAVRNQEKGMNNYIEQNLNYKSIHKDIKLLRKNGKTNEQIEQEISERIQDAAVSKESRYKRYLTHGSSLRKLAIKAKHGFRSGPKISSSIFHYMRHPLHSIGRLFEGEPDYEERSNSIRRVGDALNPYDSPASREAKEKSKEMLRLDSYRRSVDFLREGNLLSGYKAKSLDRKLDKKTKRSTRELTDIIEDEIAVILLLITGAFFIGLSTGSYSITGLSILQNGNFINNVYISNNLVVGIALILIGMFIWFYKHKRN